MATYSIDEPIPEYFKVSLPTPEANVAPSAFMSNLGGLLFGGADSGLNEYLSADQQKAMQRQAMMQAAMSLLKSGRTTTTPIGIGEALADAYQAGTTGYQGAQQNAIQQLLTKQKLSEFKRTQTLRDMLMKGLSGDQAAPTAAPTAAPMPQTQFPMPGEVISPLQSQMIPGLPVGPTVDRASLIGQAMPEGIAPPSLPAVTATAKPKTQQDIFAKLSPQQRLLVAMNPDAMLPKVFEESMKQESFDTITGQDAVEYGLDPRGKYQINNRTNQISTLQAPGDEYKIVTGADAIKLGLPGVGNYQVNTKTNQATLVGTAEGPFGGGTTGAAYNILLTEDPSSAKYALAYRELNKPVPTEQVQPDGSVRMVYTQPAPIPSSFPQPTYKGRMPTPSAAPATVVQPGGVSTAPVPSRAAPVAAPLPAATGQTGIAPGTKSTPYAPTSEQIGKARQQLLTSQKLLSAIDLLETDLNQNGMQIGGLGQAGGRQEALFQDSIMQLKELQNLGVLNGPDERLLLKQLADPTSLTSLIKGAGGADYVKSKITELKGKASREMEMINQQFPQPVMNIPKQPPAPARPQTPPAIQNLLNKYPPRKQ
jgi:hypothetical protein